MTLILLPWYLFLPSGKEPAIAFGHEEEETFIAVTEPLQG